MRHAILGLPPNIDNGPGPRTIVVKFDCAVDNTDTVVTLSSGSYTSATLTAPNTMTSDGISGVFDNSCLIINIKNVARASPVPAPPSGILADASLYLRVCSGELNNANPVTVMYLAMAKANLMKQVAPLYVVCP